MNTKCFFGHNKEIIESFIGKIDYQHYLGAVLKEIDCTYIIEKCSKCGKEFGCAEKWDGKRAKIGVSYIRNFIKIKNETN